MKAVGAAQRATAPAQRCDFCRELASDHRARYFMAYGTERSRIVMQTNRFSVLPTLGQLFRGSVLIVPHVHTETLAKLSPDALAEFRSVLVACRRRLRDLGEILVYEHGATPATGGSCGVYHAHAHVVPLPAFVSADALVPEGHAYRTDFVVTLDSFRNAEEYLLVEDCRGRTRAITIDATNRQNYGSQYMRRRLASHFHIEREWDWRAYVKQEPDLIFTIDWFRQRELRGATD